MFPVSLESPVDDQGQAIAEYALIVAVIVVLVAGTILWFWAQYQ